MYGDSNMSEETENRDLTETETTEPPPPTRLKRVVTWLFAAALLFIVSSTVEGILRLVNIGGKDQDCSTATSDEARKLCEDALVISVAQKKLSDAERLDCSKRRFGITQSLCEGNIYVMAGVNSVAPFNFAAIFYSYLIDGVPPAQLKGYAFSQPVPEILERIAIVKFLYRAIPGAIYTALAIASHGWVSVITAIVALVFGYFAMRPFFGEGMHRILDFLAIPLIGGGFIWVLTQLMMLAGTLFGSVLIAAEAHTAFSVAGSTILAMFKKTENDATDKFIKWSKAILFRGTSFF